MFLPGHSWSKLRSSHAGFSPSDNTADAVWSTQSWHELLLKLLERLQRGEGCYSSCVLPTASSGVRPILSQLLMQLPIVQNNVQLMELKHGVF